MANTITAADVLHNLRDLGLADAIAENLNKCLRQTLDTERAAKVQLSISIKFNAKKNLANAWATVKAKWPKGEYKAEEITSDEERLATVSFGIEGQTTLEMALQDAERADDGVKVTFINHATGQETTLDSAAIDRAIDRLDSAQG